MRQSRGLFTLTFRQRKGGAEAAQAVRAVVYRLGSLKRHRASAVRVSEDEKPQVSAYVEQADRQIHGTSCFGR